MTRMLAAALCALLLASPGSPQDPCEDCPVICTATPGDSQAGGVPQAVMFGFVGGTPVSGCSKPDCPQGQTGSACKRERTLVFNQFQTDFCVEASWPGDNLPPVPEVTRHSVVAVSCGRQYCATASIVSCAAARTVHTKTLCLDRGCE